MGRPLSGHLATGLRKLGIVVEMDTATGAARITAVPESVRSAFSRRTAQGEAAARAYAASQGLEWDRLDARRRVGLLKTGVQGDPRGAKTDDIANLTSWRRQVEALGWRPAGVSDPSRDIALPDRAQRLQIARAAAGPLLERDITPARQSWTGAQLRIAAARGLVASGLEDDSEIDDVAAALVEAGIGDAGTRTSVIVREVRGPRAVQKSALTTDSHVTRETRLIELARTAATDRSGALTVSEIEAAAATAGLDFSARLTAPPRRGHAGDRQQLLPAAYRSSWCGRCREDHAPAPLVSAWTARATACTGPPWHGDRPAPWLMPASARSVAAWRRRAPCSRSKRLTLQLGREERDRARRNVAHVRPGRRQAARNPGGLGLHFRGGGRPPSGQSVEAGGVIGLLTRAPRRGPSQRYRRPFANGRRRSGSSRPCPSRSCAGDVIDTLRDEDRAASPPHPGRGG